MQSYSLENNDSAASGKLKIWHQQGSASNDGKSLHFSNYSINDENLLVELVRFMPQLDFISFSSCKLPSKSLTHVAKALSSCKNLRILKFWDCDMDNIKLAILGEGIQASRVETLRIQRSKVIDMYGISPCSRLITLDASNNAVTTVESLSGLLNLQDLDLSGNRITKISDLPRFPSLKVLNLQRNSIKEVPATLKRNLPRVRRLDLGGNPIVEISNLAALTTLQTLSLPAGCSEGKVVSLFDLPQLKELFVGTQAIELPEKSAGALDSLASFVLAIICCGSYGNSSRSKKY